MKFYKVLLGPITVSDGLVALDAHQARDRRMHTLATDQPGVFGIGGPMVFKTGETFGLEFDGDHRRIVHGRQPFGDIVEPLAHYEDIDEDVDEDPDSDPSENPEGGEDPAETKGLFDKVKDALGGNKNPTDPAHPERPEDEAARIDCIAGAIGHGLKYGKLVLENTGHFTKDGKPQVEALEAILRWQPSGKDRDAAWQKHQARLDAGVAA